MKLHRKLSRKLTSRFFTIYRFGSFTILNAMYPREPKTYHLMKFLILYHNRKRLQTSGLWFNFCKKIGFRYSFICQGISTRRQRSDLCGLPIQAATCYYQSNHSKVEAIPLSALPKKNNKRTCRLFFTLFPFLTWTSSREAVNTNF